MTVGLDLSVASSSAPTAPSPTVHCSSSCDDAVVTGENNGVGEEVPHNRHFPWNDGDWSHQYPDWIVRQRGTWGERLHVKEWEDDADEETGVSRRRKKGYRAANGWMGNDLVHSATSPVRICDYMVHYGNGDPDVSQTFERGGVGTTLTGIARFTPLAESHKGFCHGGSMCSVMDDIIGWTGFLATGQCLPWSGFTAQINTSMRKPVPVGAYLVIRARIVKMERRKVYVEAKLVDASGKNDVVHATADGLVILKRGTLPWDEDSQENK